MPCYTAHTSQTAYLCAPEVYESTRDAPGAIVSVEKAGNLSCRAETATQQANAPLTGTSCVTGVILLSSLDNQVRVRAWQWGELVPHSDALCMLGDHPTVLLRPSCDPVLNQFAHCWLHGQLLEARQFE